jgi:hypothetical protein
MNLRRSERRAPSNNGFKPSTGSKSCKKKVSGKTPSTGKQSKPFFSPFDFLDLAAIDKLIATSDKHPEIPIDQLQRTAVETCGIPAAEVTAEMLLATE